MPTLKVVPPDDESGGIPASTKKRLKDIEVRVKSGESDSIRARWESGRELLALQSNKRYAYGTRESLLAELGIDRTEAWRRCRFAEVCPDEATLARFTRQCSSWTAVYKNFPPKGHAGAKAKTTSEKKPKSITKQDRADAQTVIKKLAQPGVRAALKEAHDDGTAANRARREIERQEREEARRQKEEDEWAQQVALAARHQLVAGEVTWENITAMTESYDDTLKRVEEHIDFMLIPSQIRMKVLERHFRSVQTRLFRITGKMFPDYQPGPVSDIGDGPRIQAEVVNERPR